MSNFKVKGNASGTGTVTLQSGDTNTNYTITLPNTDDTVAVLGTAQTFTAPQTFRSTNAVRSEAASTQDAVVIAGRAGGTNSYAVTMIPATLSSSTTLTLPNVNDTVAVLGASQTFTGSNTFTGDNIFRTATGTRFEEASGQDAIVLDGRNGGTNSYAVTFTPTTLSASRTVTLPNADINFVTGLGVAQGGTGTTSLTANNVVLGNGTNAVQFVAPSSNGNVLTSNGTTWVSQPISAGGQVFVAFGTTGGF